MASGVCRQAAVPEGGGRWGQECSQDSRLGRRTEWVQERGGVQLDPLVIWGLIFCMLRIFIEKDNAIFLV